MTEKLENVTVYVVTYYRGRRLPDGTVGDWKAQYNDRIYTTEAGARRAVEKLRGYSNTWHIGLHCIDTHHPDGKDG